MSRIKKPVDPRQSVAALFPYLTLEWHASKNSDLEWTLGDVTFGSRKEAWWLCPDCGHEWKADIRTRAGKRTGCPQCAIKIRGQKNSRPRPEQSFGDLFPQYVAEWHPSKNDKSPYKIKPGAKYRAIWLCPKCDSEWSACISKRVKGQGRCKKCESFGTKYPELAHEWDTMLNRKNLYQVSPASNFKPFWICTACGNGWRSTVGHRVNSGSGCPICVRVKQAIDQRKPEPGESLAETFPIIALELHRKANVDATGKILTPWDVSAKSGYSAHWICARRHQWQTTVHVRTNGSGCPKCRPASSKNEIRIFCEIRAILEDVKWLKRIYGLSIDVFIPKYKIAIEYDYVATQRNLPCDPA